MASTASATTPSDASIVVWTSTSAKWLDAVEQTPARTLNVVERVSRLRSRKEGQLNWLPFGICTVVLVDSIFSIAFMNVSDEGDAATAILPIVQERYVGYVADACEKLLQQSASINPRGNGMRCYTLRSSSDKS